MSDHYEETKRLARLIGLPHHASDTLRTVWKLTPRTDADARAGKPLLEVKVLRTAGKVRLGIVADESVRVVRSELLGEPANEPTPD